MKIKTYAVNCFDAWLNTEGDDISDSYVKYKDYQETVAALQSALDVQSARSDALAAENAALKSAIKALFPGGVDDEPCGVGFTDTAKAAYAAIKRTPATDAWVNEQRVAGVEMFVSDFTEPAVMNDGKFYSEDLIKASKDFAAQLRGSQV